MITFDWRKPVPDDRFLLFFPEEGYDTPNHEAASKKQREMLELKLGAKVSSVSIGAGADYPAWLYELPLLVTSAPAIAALIFFQGKRIKENLDAWLELGSRIKSLVRSGAYLSRSAAGALVSKEVVALLGKLPSNGIQLVSYKIGDRRFGGLIDAQDAKDGMTLEYQGDIVHVFEIVADDRVFLGIVDGCDVEVKEIFPQE